MQLENSPQSIPENDQKRIVMLRGYGGMAILLPLGGLFIPIAVLFTPFASFYLMASASSMLKKYPAHPCSEPLAAVKSKFRLMGIVCTIQALIFVVLIPVVVSGMR